MIVTALVAVTRCANYSDVFAGDQINFVDADCYARMTRARICFEHPGTISLQLVSLFQHTFNNRPNGNRIDLMRMMAAMKPHFLRLPGGNYLEGDTIKERFNWKETIGPLVDRPTHRSPWNYQSTDGLGLLEFLEWCEDLKIEPVLAVYAGYSLKGEHVVDKELEPYVQDALDEIEYVTGDVNTKWGAVRAKDGHPEPFPLHYIEIGNEDEFDKSKSYDARFAQIAKAVRANYPQYKLIATTPVKIGNPDVIDDHYYKLPEEFFDMFLRENLVHVAEGLPNVSRRFGFHDGRLRMLQHGRRPERAKQKLAFEWRYPPRLRACCFPMRAC